MVGSLFHRAVARRGAGLKTLLSRRAGDNYGLSRRWFHRSGVLQDKCFAASVCNYTACIGGASRSLTTEPFLNGEASPYMEQMYEAWVNDPSSVHVSWNAYFTNLANGVSSDRAFCLPDSLPSQVPLSKPAAASPFSQTAYDTSRIIQLVQGYQSRGHEFAKIDPLGLPHEPPYVSEARRDARRIPIDYQAYGFTQQDLDREFSASIPGACGFLSMDRGPITLRELVKRLEETYCSSIGVEAMHIEDPTVLNYLRQVLEVPKKFEFSADMKRTILYRTAKAQLFETFCGTKFSTSKRFGIDGCESSIIAIKEVAKKSAQMGVESIVIGMPHRGRLNLLMNVLRKPMQQMMREFQGITGFGGTEWGNTGDVKYHLGVDCHHYDEDAKRHIHMCLMANPSHLEAVDPLVLGQVRAQQYYSGDADRTRVLPIIMHGDASFAGQGVVYETLQMSKLPNYRVGGTIHVVVNNQIGFTTNVVDQGSGRYPTDIAKCIDAPVFHVNADDPEACTYVAQLALDYRQRFHNDVFINLVGYRRLGHNELDMPKFTQPRMYNHIAQHPPVLDVYAQRLVAENVMTQKEIDDVKKDILAFYSQEYEQSKLAATQPEGRDESGGDVSVSVQAPRYRPQWRHMAPPSQTCPPQASGVPIDILQDVGRAISTLPAWLTPHPTIKKTYKARAEAVETGENIDFGFAEALAFGTLIRDGFNIRLGGQDVQRGTFSHRHAVVHDQSVGTPSNGSTADGGSRRLNYCALAELFPAEPTTSGSEENGVKTTAHRSRFEVCNSLLSEFAALGFEVGYALEHPDTLAIWEAQFGDFANGAQVIIDQFIASGETKWGSQCGIVMLLPHGYDGQGPEHSSARIERFLQLCDDREDVIHPESWDTFKRSVIQRHNFQVVNCTTPANFFHVLRRQMHRGFRKPLVVISSKRMLKMRATFSRLAELAEGTCFLRYIPNIATQERERPSFIGVECPLPIDESVTRLVLCSGQVYYDLAAYREKHGLWSVALARVEQLSPFPFDRVVDDIRRYPHLQDVVWAQEEPMNMGPWPYTSKRLATSLAHIGYPNGITHPIYAGRDVSAAPAGGDARLHQVELERLLGDAFDVHRRTNSYVEKYLGPTAAQEAQAKPAAFNNGCYDIRAPTASGDNANAAPSEEQHTPQHQASTTLEQHPH